MDAPLELRAERDGERTLLRAPEVGYLTCARAQGALVGPGEEVGVLLQLGRAFRLVVPAGVLGRIVSAAPDRKKEPVEYGQVLYELESIEGGIAEVELVLPGR